MLLLFVHEIRPPGRIALKECPGGRLGTVLHQLKERVEDQPQQRFVPTQRLGLGFGRGGNDEGGGVADAQREGAIRQDGHGKLDGDGQVGLQTGGIGVGQFVEHVEDGDHEIVVLAVLVGDLQEGG